MPDNLPPEQPTASEVIVSPQGSLPALQKWFGDEMVRLWSAWPPADRRWMLMGCPAWGDYVERLVRWTLPTVLAPENMAAVAPCWLVIFTDPHGYAAVHNSTKNLRAVGIHPIVILIPDAVLAEARRHPANRYWILGAAQNLLMRMADFAGAGFHMLMPDHLYGPRYFVGLKRLSAQHEIIAQTGISSEIGGVTRDIERFRHAQGWLSVPDADLGNIAWRHLHAQTRAYLMNDATIPDRMPNAHYLCWQGERGIVSYCCHMNATWLSAEVCRSAPNFMPATIDTRLPHFAKTFYVPQVADEMTFIEISGSDKAAAKEKVGFDMFAAKCWAQTGFSDAYMPYFLQPSVTPIHPQKTFLPDDVIAEQAKRVASMLMAVRPPKWMASIQQMSMEGT